MSPFPKISSSAPSPLPYDLVANVWRFFWMLFITSAMVWETYFTSCIKTMTMFLRSPTIYIVHCSSSSLEILFLSLVFFYWNLFFQYTCASSRLCAFSHPLLDFTCEHIPLLIVLLQIFPLFGPPQFSSASTSSSRYVLGSYSLDGRLFTSLSASLAS